MDKARGMTRTSERLEKVLNLRDGGATFSDIATELGVSKSRAHELYKKAVDARDVKLNKDCISVLGSRAFNCLVNLGVSPKATRDEVRARLPELRSKVKMANNNFGPISLREIEEWLGQ